MDRHEDIRDHWLRPDGAESASKKFHLCEDSGLDSSGNRRLKTFCGQVFSGPYEDALKAFAEPCSACLRARERRLKTAEMRAAGKLVR